MSRKHSATRFDPRRDRHFVNNENVTLNGRAGRILRVMNPLERHGRLYEVRLAPDGLIPASTRLCTFGELKAVVETPCHTAMCECYCDG